MPRHADHRPRRARASRAQRRRDARPGRRAARQAQARSPAAAARRRASGTPRAARCWRASASICWSIPAPPFLELSPLAAHGLYGGDVHSAEHHHRRRAHLGPRMRHRRQRRHHQGRHLLSDDGEEASARAGHRAAEQSALRLHGRFRRRLPADAGRDLSRRAAFRPHLLQPGADVRAGHSADRDRDGLLHRRRRLCAGDVGREHHRAQPGHDLPRRPAAGEGRDRRGRHAPKSSAAPTCIRGSPASPIITRRTTRTRSASRGASSPR